MESTYVFNHCIFALLAVLLYCATVVNSQVNGEGSATGAMCDTDNPCTETDEICFQPDVDAEPTCIIDPCRTGTFENGGCPTSEKCISAGNCGSINGMDRCNDIPSGSSYTCIDPCLTDTSCPPTEVCSFDATISKEVMCNGGVSGVCQGVNCNGNGACHSLPDAQTADVVAQCTCNEGYFNRNATTCESDAEAQLRASSENKQLYRLRFTLRVVNYPWEDGYLNPNSQVYREYEQICIFQCVRLYSRQPGFQGCRLTGLSPGSIITQMEVIFDNPLTTDQVGAEVLMGDLANRTNVNTNVPEDWWGPYLQIDETDIVFQQVSNESPTTSSSALLPAVLGSTMAVVVIVLAVVLLYYFGRVCRNRYYAGTYDDSEDTETTYQTRSTPQYFYTRNNPQHYGWGMHGQPNYWSTSPTQQQGSWGDRQWFWTNRQGRGVYNAT